MEAEAVKGAEAKLREAKDAMPGSLGTAQQAADELLESSEQGNDADLMVSDT